MNYQLSKRVCLITGGTSGVGRATALGLARLGATVIIVCHTRESGEGTVKEMILETGNSNIDYITADFAEPDSIREAVSAFKEKYNKLHVLSNNAAVLPMKRKTNSLGIELTFAINYLSHFMLTNLLCNLLKNSKPARVLTVAGNIGIIKHGNIHFDDIQLEHSFNPLKATLQATFAKTIFALELAKKLEHTGVTSNAFHPGLVRSRLGRNFPFPLSTIATIGMIFLSRECKSAVSLASHNEYRQTTGLFYERGKFQRFKARNYNRETGEKLWKISEKLCGLSE